MRDAWVMAGRTEPGCLRTINEDALAVAPDIGLALVADGMGGHRAGGVAARLAVESIERRLRAAHADRRNAQRPAGELLREAVIEADRTIRHHGAADPQQQGMGTTIACLLVRDGEAHLAHVGDTRVYRLRDGVLQLMTRDHTFARYAREAGLVSDDEYGASHNRHFVTHALGVTGEDGIEMQQLETRPGDVFLLCSDGLNDMVDGVDIELVLDTLSANLPMAADQLVMIACDCGGHDNVSVALVRIDATTGIAENTMPAAAGRSLFGRLRNWLGRSA